MPKSDRDLDSLVRKFVKEIYSSEIPAGVEIMKERCPEFLKKWLELRNIAKYEGYLPLKTRHLIWLTSQAIRMNRPACVVHIKGALEAGAKEEEIVETAMIMYITAGGTVGDLVLDALRTAKSS